MAIELKCKTCVAPDRHPGCHSTCKYYQEWSEEHARLSELERKNKYMQRLGSNNKRRKNNF